MAAAPEKSSRNFARTGAAPKLLPGFCLLLALLLYAGLFAQTTVLPDYVRVSKINIEGNKKTKERLILRELEFRVGDSLPAADLNAIFERNQLRLMNLDIFSSAVISIDHWVSPAELELRIELVESWYLFPIPLFELADRNFNVWWEEQHRSLKRVNYGLDLNYLNLTGNADILKAKLQFGYANKYELSYEMPAVNRKQTIGIGFGVYYSRSKEVAVTTDDNKLVFLKDPNNWQIIRFAARGGLQWRPAYYNRHSFSFDYFDNSTSDTIVGLNPDFFLQGKNRQRHLNLIYNFTSDHRDIQPYPLHGWRLELEYRLNGLLPANDLHLMRFYAGFDYYTPVVKKLTLEARISGRTSLPRGRPPYYNNQALGYGGSFVRGYEYYVVDGLDFVLVRTALHYELFSRTFDLHKIIPFKAYNSIPLKLYISLNNDTGYANDPYYYAANPLTNHLLYGYGMGLDFVILYNKTIRVEWSRNDLGESGFFLRVNTGF